MADIYNKINGTSHHIIIAETEKTSGGDDSEDPEFAEEDDPEYVRYSEYIKNEDTEEGKYRYTPIEQGPHKGDMIALRKDFW